MSSEYVATHVLFLCACFTDERRVGSLWAARPLAGCYWSHWYDFPISIVRILLGCVQGQEYWRSTTRRQLGIQQSQYTCRTEMVQSLHSL